ncbi:aspartic peptidase domain-containing protein [Melanogaster broomeanus]|nr:aspartic peptidase domain-containing protein [Melanogaster broomeanus]
MNLRALSLAALVGTSMAIKIPTRQAKRSTLRGRNGGTSVSVSKPPSTLTGSHVLAASNSSSNSSLTLSDVQDLIYIANVTVGGVSFPVQLDTGSSDLWVQPTAGQLPTATASATSLNLTYGIGWAQGQVAYASAVFAGITVSEQAYLNVSSAENPALSYGAAGILGLGFDSLSTIDATINATGSSSGRTLLYNLFEDNPSEPNFIAFSLQSSSDGDNIEGSFSIGETDPQYANVTNTNKIPTWPTTAPSRWNVLLDSFIVGTQTNDVSTTVPGVPSNKAVVLLDSGTSYTYAPVDACTAIYGGVSGAQYDPSLGQWVVPCDVEIDIALQIDGQIFPIHPLDVTPTSVGDKNTCVGSFVPQSVAVEAGQFDWLLGDNVLRSVYALYDFGDFDASGNTGDPYVQMLALIDPNQASAEFHAARGGTANNNITYGVSDSGSGATTVTLSTDVATTIDKLSTYLPAMLGVMALNAFVLLVLAVLGIILICRRRGKAPRARKTPGRLDPMPMNNTMTATRLSDIHEDVPHRYQPVSMALSEDPLFHPPSPAFTTDSARFGDRPMSVA